MESKTTRNEKIIRTRLTWIDTVKAIAIFFVILVHCTETVYKFNLEGIGKESLCIQFSAFSLFTIGRLGVPLFMMATGYLLIIPR